MIHAKSAIFKLLNKKLEGEAILEGIRYTGGLVFITKIFAHIIGK